MINAFVQLLLAIGQVQSDVIGYLPTELGAKIFRYLDEDSLVCVAGVNHRWNSICKGDPNLRRRIRRGFQKERRSRVQAYVNASAGVKITRSNPAAMFGQRNGTVAVKTNPVKYEVTASKGTAQMKKFNMKKMNKVRRTGIRTKNLVDENNNVNINSRKLLRM